MANSQIKTDITQVAVANGWIDKNKASGEGEYWHGRSFKKEIDGVTYNVAVTYTEPSYGSKKAAQIKEATFQHTGGRGYNYYKLPWREQYGNEMLAVFNSSVVDLTKRQKVEFLLTAPQVIAWLIAEKKHVDEQARLAREAQWAAQRKQRSQPIQITGSQKVFTESANRAWDLARAIYNFDGATEPTEIENKVKQLAEAVHEIQLEGLGYAINVEQTKDNEEWKAAQAS